MPRRISRCLLRLGFVVLCVYVGRALDRFFMGFFRTHYEGLLQTKFFWDLSYISMGMIYWIKPGRLSRLLAVSLMALANAGFLAALSILFSVSPEYPVYYDYLNGVRNILFLPCLTVNITGAYYLLRGKSQASSQEPIAPLG